ncbi:MAG: homoserine dehydrogenase [Anaerolineae bacterium]|nr:homoserine dehydrogenase [Anaerolineae bacterium]
MTTRVPIIFLGVGNIGGTLLRQILDSGEEVARRTGLQLAPIALADVSGVLLDPDGLFQDTLHAALDAVTGGGLLEVVSGIRPLDEVTQALQPGAIVADMTATPKTTPTLLAAMEAKCGVVLANKIPLAADWSAAKTFFEYPDLRYECTVGAGLPVIDTLQYLLDTGDHVTKIEGCLSGTLGYLCAELERGVPYSAAVAQAKKLGYTEPDPRDDLSGKDVARKALILARTAGWPLEENDLNVEALYSESLAGLSIEGFMAATPTLDGTYAVRIEEAKAAGKVLRYVAQVGPAGGSVGLTAVECDSSLGALRGPANYVALHTERYAEVPLVISGPGAGREVTAAGVMGDIIKLASLQVSKFASSE